MDVIFEPQKGTPFSIEVGFFDTILEIKEKIEKYRQIPIPKQTLIFKGNVLQDEHDMEFYEILQNSRIHLIVASEPEKSSLTENPSLSNKITLNINILPRHLHVPVEMDADDCIGRLKERIHEIEDVQLDRLVLRSGGGAELQDQRSLREYELSEGSTVDVILRPLTTMAVPTSGSKKMKVMVQAKCGSQKIQMEVNASDNVEELKKELEKQQQKLPFVLPSEGFFFIYDRDVMDEDRSFRWHGVSHGDTIEIFDGSVTGGS